MSGKKPAEWQSGTVTSQDGTRISFFGAGRGPGLVVIPGNNRCAHHYQALTQALSDTYSVHVIDRRGRGLSGPQGPDYSIETEADDALAVMDRTGAQMLFGHSYGGLVTLHVGLRRKVSALMAYEPAVSIGGGFPSSWLPSFTRLLNEGKHTAAMATFLKATRLAPIGDAPTPVFRALAFLLLLGTDGRETRAMMPTTPPEMNEIFRLDSDGSRYAGVDSPTLLLGGEKTPAYVTDVLPRLARVVPDARHVILPGLDHNAPDLNAPDVVAEQIRTFAQERLPGERTHHTG
ncbi:alpha/beta hydrolase [Planotetraspora phitsanulokensis]|uniref:Alpha/beta hydrolase n=2 Tax=Planotetraspora phitsanulokensis TaxID=575192 RepID=A0A8J3UF24_9ACTN|nr:alpha/beta hydrolase [Planotetraspora phitsanulokensis]